MGAGGDKLPAKTLTSEQFHQGIQLLWDKIQQRHPDPYRMFSKAQFEVEVERMVGRSGDVTEAQAFVETSRLIGMLCDGHSWVSIDDDSMLFSRAIPVRFWAFSDGLHVRAAAPSHAELLGATVLAIHGVPIERAWEQIRDAAGGGGRLATVRAQVYAAIPEFLHAIGLADNDQEIVLELRLADGTQVRRTLRATSYENFSEVWNTSHRWAMPAGWVGPAGALRAGWYANRDKVFWSETLDGGKTLYLAFNQASTDPDNPWDPKVDQYRPFVKEAFARAREEGVERVIIDLRNNNGGNSALWQPLVHQIIRTEKLYLPGHLFVVIGRLTESAAVAWAARIEMNAPALFVGEPTVNPPNFANDPAGWRREAYHLPGSAVNFRVANTMEHWSDDGDKRRAIYPDIPVAMSWTDFASSRDPSLRAIAEFRAADADALFLDDEGESLVAYPWANYQRKTQGRAMREDVALPPAR